LHSTQFNRKNETTRRWRVRNAKLGVQGSGEVERRDQFETFKVQDHLDNLGFEVVNKVTLDPADYPGYKIRNHLTGKVFAGFFEATTFIIKLRI